MGRNTSNFRFGSLGFLPARSLFWNGSPTYFQPLSFLWGMYLEVLDTYLRSAPFPISVVRLSGIGWYLWFIRRVLDRCQKSIRYLLMIQHQILFLNLLNKCQMKSDDDLSDVFWRPIWWIKGSACLPSFIRYFYVGTNLPGHTFATSLFLSYWTIYHSMPIT